MSPLFWKLVIMFLKQAAMFIHVGPEYIFEFYNVATLYIPDCLEEFIAFHAEFLTEDYIKIFYGEAYYKDFQDFCYGEDHALQPPSLTELETPKVENPVETSEIENPVETNTEDPSDNKKQRVRLKRRISPGPHPGVFTNSPDYMDFLAKKLNPNLKVYSSSKDLLGDKFPPADGSLINDFFSEGHPDYNFPQYFYFLPDYPFDSFPVLSNDSFFIAFDGYSIDGELLNKKTPIEFQYGFSKDIFVFAKTAYDFIREPHPFDPELEEFFIDLYRAATRPRYVRKVFYKNKKDLTKPKSFRIRKRTKNFFKKKK